MSEPVPQYVTDALEMAGMNEPQKIETVISGYVPVFDALLRKYDNPITPLVFGKMWLYCNMVDRVCRAALATIGGELNIDASTVSRHAERLVADGFLVDLTPELKNRPHVYMDAGKVVMKNALNAHLAESKASLAQSKASLAENRLSTLVNTQDNIAANAAKPDLVDGVIRYSLGPKDIQRAIARHFRLTPNWEGNKFNRQWMQWAIQEGVTPEQIETAARVWQTKFNIPPNLKMIQEHWLSLREAQRVAPTNGGRVSREI